MTVAGQVPRNPPKPDRLGADYKQGPNPNPGGEIDTGDSAVPPYEGRSLGTGETPLGERSAMGKEPERGVPDRPESLEDTRREPEMAPDGVGESITRGGEDVAKKEGKEPGRIDTGSEGPSARPTGTSTLRDQTSLDPDDDSTA